MGEDNFKKFYNVRIARRIFGGKSRSFGICHDFFIFAETFFFFLAEVELNLINGEY